MEDSKSQQTLNMNPYVGKVEKMVCSIQHLAQVYSEQREPVVRLTKSEIQEMTWEVQKDVCAECKGREGCIQQKNKNLYPLVYEVTAAIDNYGNELSVEVKRKLQHKCSRSQEFLQKVIGTFGRIKQDHIWELKLREKQKECAEIVQTFSQSIYGMTKDLGASIYVDERLEKSIKKRLAKQGIRTMGIRIYLSKEGRYELELTARAVKGSCVSINIVVDMLSRQMGRDMIVTTPGLYMLNDEYTVLRLEEKPKYRMLYGVAKKSKAENHISGDNFLVQDRQRGKKILALADGMGSGKKACMESKCMIELLEELLEAGFHAKAASAMVNQTLLLRREEVCFTTLDLCECDLYSGELSILKAGATITYIKSGNTVRRCGGSALPLGVLSQLSLSECKEQLHSGEYIIMLTDGVEEALPIENRFLLLEMILSGITERNPKEIARGILEQVQELSDNQSKDDMMVLVAGLWGS